METQKSKTSSSDTSTKNFRPVVILCHRMVQSNVLIVLSPMVSKVVWLVLVFPLHTGPLPFFMSCVSKIHFREMDKVLPLFICRPERKTTSRISVLLAVEFGFILQVFKQRGSRIKLEKVSSLDMFHIPHKTSFGTTLNLNNVKLLFTVYSMKDSMTSL